MMAQLSGSLIISWLLCLAVAIVLMAVIETFFRESLLRRGFNAGLRIWTYIIAFAFLSSLGTAPLLDKAQWLTAVLFHTLAVVVVLLYFVPTAIAIGRSSDRIESIFFVNLLAGWTVIGWFWALVESFGDARREQVQIAAERATPLPQQKKPFISEGTLTREPPRYLAGKGVEQHS